MMATRLEQQIGFLIEIDQLKSILRQSYLMDSSRRENTAEHSWYVAMAAPILAEYAPRGVDHPRAISMMLVHDLIEIDAGDTFLYDEAGTVDKAAREIKAADRLFSLLPEDQNHELRALWEEFETGATPTARFARALDRLMPLMHNYYTHGKTWKEHGVHATQVLKMNSIIEKASAELWQFARDLINDAVAKGYLLP
jgi:putative hydrolases of HD superfamily